MICKGANGRSLQAVRQGDLNLLDGCLALLREHLYQFYLAFSLLN